jgi:hypothetical protein
MQLGEIIATYDLGLALRGESGKFEVTGPGGEIYRVICKADHSISNMEWAGNQTNTQPFMIRKITETVSAGGGNETTATQNRTGGAPFLLESQAEDGEPLFASVARLPSVAEEKPARHRANFELVYVEVDPGKSQPAAWVSLTSEQSIQPTESTSMTVRCVTFNELDAEIRRLHAQLDEIRARAKKKFYTAHAAASA